MALPDKASEDDARDATGPYAALLPRVAWLEKKLCGVAQGGDIGERLVWLEAQTGVPHELPDVDPIVARLERLESRFKNRL